MLLESQVVAAEIEKVAGDVPTLFDRDGTFLSWVEKRKLEKVSARDMRIPLEMRPGGNFGHADPDGGDLGLGDGPTFDKALVPTFFLKEGIQWTKKSEWATDDSRKSVINTFRYLLSKGMAEFRRNLDSLCMTAGNGVLGTILSVVINTPVGFDTINLSTTDGFGARLLRYGLTVSIWNSALTVLRAGGEKKINFYDGANKQVQIPTGTVGIVATDKLVVSAAPLSGGSPTSIYGVPYHHGVSGTWLGLSRTANPETQTPRVNAAGSALALPFARLAASRFGDRAGIDRPMKVTAWMHPAQVQAYEELAQLVMVINKGSSKEGVDLYFNNEDMRIAGIPIRKSFSWDKTRIDFVDSDAWGRAEMHSAGFYEVDGRKIWELRGASGGIATSQIFYLCVMMNLFMYNPIAGAYIDNLLFPSGY